MKKAIMGFILGVILSLTITVFAGSIFSKNIELYIDGELTEYEKSWEQTAFEALGANVAISDTKVEIIKPEPPEPIYAESMTNLEAIAKDCKGSCVMIYAHTPDGVMQGSGWVYKGYVITANHVIEGATKIEIATDGSAYTRTGQIHYTNTILDVAVLETSVMRASLKLGDSDALKEGEKLVSITSPDGIMNAIDECINSGLTYYIDVKYLTISETNMKGGSSGGAIFNYKGEVVAMVLSGNEGGEHAIPINDIKPILANLK